MESLVPVPCREYSTVYTTKNFPRNLQCRTWVHTQSREHSSEVKLVDMPLIQLKQAPLLVTCSMDCRSSERSTVGKFPKFTWPQNLFFVFQKRTSGNTTGRLAPHYGRIIKVRFVYMASSIRFEILLYVASFTTIGHIYSVRHLSTGWDIELFRTKVPVRKVNT